MAEAGGATLQGGRRLRATGGARRLHEDGGRAAVAL